MRENFLVNLAISSSVITAVGTGIGMLFTFGVGMAQDSILATGETLKNDYKVGNITLDQYEQKMKSLAKTDADLTVYKTTGIVSSVVFALASISSSVMAYEFSKEQ